jgi:alpha-1,3-rhamnosyl/mannosyltransferase
MTVSQASAKDIAHFLSINPTKIDLVTEGPDPSFFAMTDESAVALARTECRVPEGARLLIYVGGFNRHKNVIRLIEAMPQVLKAHPNAYLAIVGRTTGARFWDNIEELKASAASDAQSSGRIGFTGEISDALMAKLLNSAEALVFPSLWEGFGLPAVEAMACHTPVLSSDRGSLPEVVGDGGILFDPTDADAIAGEIIRFLGDDLLRARLKASAAKQAALFSWDRAAEMSEVSFRRAAGLNGAS